MLLIWIKLPCIFYNYHLYLCLEPWKKWKYLRMAFIIIIFYFHSG